MFTLIGLAAAVVIILCCFHARRSCARILNNANGIEEQDVQDQLNPGDDSKETKQNVVSEDTKQ